MPPPPLTNPSLEDGFKWAVDVDPESGEYQVFINDGNRIDLPTGGTVVSAARVILNNTFATIPITGQTYATAQFIGRGPTEASFQISGVGGYQLSRIQSMTEELERNARGYRKIKGAARVNFEGNELLQLCGIKDGIISSVDTETDEQGTDLYRMQLSFTSDGHHMESLNQERFVDYRNFKKVLDILLTKVSFRVVSTLDYHRHQVQERIPTFEILNQVIDSVPLISSRNRATLRSIAGHVLLDEVNNPDRNISTPEGLLGILRAEVERHTRLGRGMAEAFSNEGGRVGAAYEVWQRREELYVNQPIRTPVPAEQDRGVIFEAIEDREHDWLNPQVQKLVDSLTEWIPKLPGLSFYQGNRRGKYLDLSRTPSRNGTLERFPEILDDNRGAFLSMLYGQRSQWATVRELRGQLDAFQAALYSVAQSVYWDTLGRPGHGEVFPGLSEEFRTANEQTEHATYQDLDLPPHPATGKEIDTEPDFYFWNDSEDGMLNEIGPEVIAEVDQRLLLAEESYARLNSGETWNQTYLGRSRTAISGMIDNVIAPSHPRFQMDGAPTSPLQMDNVTTGPDASPNVIESTTHIGGGPNERNPSNTVVGRALTLGSTSRMSSDPLVQQRRREMLLRTSMALPGGTPSSPLNIGPVDNAITGRDRRQSFNRNYIKEQAVQSIIQNPDETLTMRRAFPTFKIYFLEDDTGIYGRPNLLPGGYGSGPRAVMYFDDFYNYNSIKEIRLIKSRKNPTDLLILTLTNVAGLLERRQWESPHERPTEIYGPAFEGTQMENPLKKLILKEGLKVQAKLGYTNRPSNMEVEFIGEVVEVSYNASCSDEVTIICQSYGSELVLETKGDTYGQRVAFRDTPDILHTMMCSPELVHFGRYSPNPQFNPGEARGIATSRGEGSAGLGIIPDPGTIADEIAEHFILNNSKWILANNPADDNIYAPSLRDYMSWSEQMGQTAAGWFNWYAAAQRTMALPGFKTVSGWAAGATEWLGSFFDGTSIYSSGQTIWEIIKECELRHPGWIGHPVPYGTRMTLFFGVPSFRYWADEISYYEMEQMAIFRNQISNIDGNIFGGEDAERSIWHALSSWGRIGHARGSTALASGNTVGAFLGPLFALMGSPEGAVEGITRKIFSDVTRANRGLSMIGEYIGRTLGRFKPFRKHHIITSEHHIIANNIRASEKGTFNAVNLRYNGGDIYTLKADDSIPDEKTKVENFDYPNVSDESLARRYCIGLLNRHLKDIYKGEIIVTGMNVKPYDSIFLHDERANMYGVFDVEQVVQTFTPQTGWITEITPDLVTGANEWSTMGTKQAREAVTEVILKRYYSQKRAEGFTMGQLHAQNVIYTGVAASASLIPYVGFAVPIGAALAWAGGYEIIRWTQDRQPLWVCPLILGERPFFAGLDGFRQDGLFANLRGRLIAQIDDVERGWRAMHMDGLFSDFAITTSQTLAGQGGP